MTAISSRAPNVDDFARPKPIGENGGGKFLTYALMVILALAIIVPLLITLAQSFQINETLYNYPPLIFTPKSTTANWENLFAREDLQLVQWVINSFVVASVHTIFAVTVSGLAAYAFARLRFPGKNILFIVLLVTLMIPGQVTLIPNYLVFRDLNLLKSTTGVQLSMLIPGVANVLGVFLLRQFFIAIPNELEEAAILDGASRFGVFWRIILPLSTSALTALAIFLFQANWNELLWPLIIASKAEQYTLPVGLSILSGSYGPTQRGLVLAGAIFSAIPVLVVYLLFQRQIIKGVSFTGGLGGR